MKRITLFGCLAAVSLFTSTVFANSRMAHSSAVRPRARSTINRPAMPAAMARSPRMVVRDQFRAGNFRSLNDRREQRFENRNRAFFNDRREDRFERNFNDRREDRFEDEDRDRFVFVDPFFFGFGFPFYASYYHPSGYYYPYDYEYYNYGQPAYGVPSYSASIVVQVQTRLARAGYYHGAIDGVMGPRTRYAIRVYERIHGLRVDGAISQQLLATMGARY